MRVMPCPACTYMRSSRRRPAPRRRPAAYGGATSCPLPPKPPTAEEIAAQLARKEEVLESVDGMVG